MKTSTSTYSLAVQTLPLDDRWDVIVAGGGPAGCTAAIAAAREGAKTLLIEASGFLGGAATGALVPAWCPFSDKEKIIYRGLAEKVFTEAKKGVPHIKEGDLDWVPIDAERLKRVYDTLVTEAGVSVLFKTFIATVQTGGPERIDALIAANKEGLTAFRAKVYIDCTGDADLAARAGVPFQKGDTGGLLQPATHCFILSNVDEYAFQYNGSLGWWNPQSPIHAIAASGKFPGILDKHLVCNTVGPGAVGFNAGHLWDVDGTDPWSVSRALMAGRRLALTYRDALAEHAPGAFANAFVMSTGPDVGIRETRRIEGDYTLTLEDYIARRSFPDDICRNSYFIDMHATKDEMKSHDETKLALRFEHYKKGESHGIPYRCLVPRGVKNLLVAGRSISCERAVQGSVRVMPVCLAMGEAAGIAAAQALRQPEPDMHAVDTGTLRRRLLEAGAYLGGEDRQST